MENTTRNELVFWFDFGSNYSYLSLLRIRALQRDTGLAVCWRPFLLGPIFKSQGWASSPFVLQKEKGAYVWLDMLRQCEKYGLPWRRPSDFPRLALLPTRVALHAAEQPWLGDFCERVMLRNFRDDLDIGSDESVAAVLLGLGLDAGAIIAAAQEEANKQKLRQRTAQAQALGIFGAPTFFVGADMFWGNDRLDDALAHGRSRAISSSA
ncbi:2-hydroxychromene-2-carboxylate isomerase [Rugamonas sp. CCM 8940]|uniref:2-hydroxychromene-2-carboxylate isomerase n=1 Tax=Rugamonas sp. CCM 8940 TaxID=2765359 RepID=UPI0018F7B37E|nr:2-hydroxychromene-2-carboxylate isomerase [Rugamonas sp. CCM 8940]MBJ7309003.1 2-hydroxychromene-2-carboxylate isomerase [Rugamonas sp. CCM 8940]